MRWIRRRFSFSLEISAVIITSLIIWKTNFSATKSPSSFWKQARTNRSSPIIEVVSGYLILRNFIKATAEFHGNESVTFATPGDYLYLDNLAVLVDRWNGPISVALHTPGYDLHSAFESIAYLRNCVPGIKEFASFHLIIPKNHTPNKVNLLKSYIDEFNCTYEPPYKISKKEDSYRSKYKLKYPINLARNIAKQSATTHFILTADLELYPSPNFIAKFLKLLQNSQHQNRVYVVPNFEVAANESVPDNKTQLLEMIKNKTAVSFHVHTCPQCHTIPKYNEWLETFETDNFDYFYFAKRVGNHKYWEPFYVSTLREPSYDEEMMWDGSGDQMSNEYILCLLDYDFVILNNAFLVHKPGIKIVSTKKSGDNINKNNVMNAKLKVDLDRIFGHREGCSL